MVAREDKATSDVSILVQYLWIPVIQGKYETGQTPAHFVFSVKWGKVKSIHGRQGTTKAIHADAPIAPHVDLHSRRERQQLRQIPVVNTTQRPGSNIRREERTHTA